MGLSSFPSPAEGGVLPVLVMNTVVSVALLKNMVRYVLHVVGANNGIDNYPNLEEESLSNNEEVDINNCRARRVSITRFESMCNMGVKRMECCCVCLSSFREKDEVSELSCNHFFHKGCLDKWFGNQHTTCPLCRSIM